MKYILSCATHNFFNLMWLFFNSEDSGSAYVPRQSNSTNCTTGELWTFPWTSSKYTTLQILHIAYSQWWKWPHFTSINGNWRAVTCVAVKWGQHRKCQKHHHIRLVLGEGAIFLPSPLLRAVHVMGSPYLHHTVNLHVLTLFQTSRTTAAALITAEEAVSILSLQDNHQNI